MVNFQTSRDTVGSHAEDCALQFRKAVFEDFLLDSDLGQLKLRFQKMAIFRSALIAAAEYIEDKHRGVRADVIDITTAQAVAEGNNQLTGAVKLKTNEGESHEVFQLDWNGAREELTTHPDTRIKKELHDYFWKALAQGGFSLPIICSSLERVCLQKALWYLKTNSIVSVDFDSLGLDILTAKLGRTNYNDLLTAMSGSTIEVDTIRLSSIESRRTRLKNTHFLDMAIVWSHRVARITTVGSTSLSFEVPIFTESPKLKCATDHGIKVLHHKLYQPIIVPL